MGKWSLVQFTCGLFDLECLNNATDHKHFAIQRFMLSMSTFVQEFKVTVWPSQV